jgi:hypothetical protein
MRGTQHTGRMTTEGHADIEVHTAPLCTKKRARRHVNRIIECRASSVQVERRVSSIPTSSVERSSRASGSGQCPTVDRREDGRGVTVSAASTVEHRAFESSVGRRASSVGHSNVERAWSVRVEHRRRACFQLTAVEKTGQGYGTVASSQGCSFEIWL